MVVLKQFSSISQKLKIITNCNLFLILWKLFLLVPLKKPRTQWIPYICRHHITKSCFTIYQESDKFLSPVARRLQSDIALAHRCNTWYPSAQLDLMCACSKHEIRTSIVTTMVDVFLSSQMPAVFVKYMKRELRRS